MVALTPLGLGRARSGHHTAADDRRRGPHAGQGATRAPSGRAGGGARRCPVVAHRWVQRRSERAAHPLRAVGTAPASIRHRASAHVPLDAPAAAALGAGDQDRAAPAPGAGAPPRDVRDPGGRRAEARGVRLAPQHGLRRAPPSHPPPAWGRYGTARHDAVQTRGGPMAAVGLVPHVRHLLFASRQLTRAVATAPTDPWDGLRHTVAALDAGPGGGTDGPCLDVARRVVVAYATLAAAGGSVRIRGGKRQEEGA